MARRLASHQRSIWAVASAGALAALATTTIWWRAAAPVSTFSEQPAVIARGARIYAERCALCHGGNLQGQPDWQSPRPDGKMPAPPHNSDGHTWHHDSATLFGLTKYGPVPPWAPPNYRSDMPAFAGRLSEEDIWAVLAFIASTWSEEAKAWQRQIEEQARRRPLEPEPSQRAS